MPKIGAVLLLIILILVGAALVGLAVAVLRRPRRATKAPKVPKMRKAESAGGEKEVYERLYGKPRSTTVSVAVPEERPPGRDVDRPWAGLSE